ncbi:hypothetical protein ACFB49_35810 [Sphingomonas sp. DBB INV C78]|uniref:DUF2264 domain-containing protein n=1 Tax=Sphingomonas sp. DBB INV C78 TaxID=3349434 RepID=UPI0036D3886B
MVGQGDIRLDPERPSPFNPLAGNPLATRDDVARALRACFAPLRPCFSAGSGQVEIEAAGATYDRSAAGLEGFARPLWGLAAAAAGGADEADWWPLYRQGIANGTDPSHTDYWGELRPFDQRIVEAAALAAAITLARDRLWDPLDAPIQDRLADYLVQARRQPCFDNNWQLFPVLIDLGLAAAGRQADDGIVETALTAVEHYHVGDGWYADGHPNRLDHYSGFAFHFYGLILSRLGGDRFAMFRDRAAPFAQQWLHWCADDGAILPFGRSLTYRFGAAAFFGACAFADVEVLPWGVLKGLYLRHLRWWRQWPITRRDGVLSVGYGYPDANMAEGYNAPGSPYWAFKAFLPLALPEEHPFWSSPEQPMPARPSPFVLRHPRMLAAHEPGQTTVLASAPAADVAGGAEKYAKFAYSTRYAFAVEAERHFDRIGFDGSIGLCDAEENWRMRDGSGESALIDDTLYSVWRPWPDVGVESWIYWDRPWHIRLHRIRSSRRLTIVEGGFALPRPDGSVDGGAGADRAWCQTEKDFSGMLSLTTGRAGKLIFPQPNSHLLHPRAMVPQLVLAMAAEEALIGTAVIASPDKAMCRAAWHAPHITPRELRTP